VQQRVTQLYKRALSAIFRTVEHQGKGKKMRVLPTAPRFGTQLVIDTHEMTRREMAKFTPQATQGVEKARRMLAADGLKDTLTMFYADDMVGQSTQHPNYLGFELNKGDFPETQPVNKLHGMKNPNDVVRTIFEAYWKLTGRVIGEG
jgi:hypothetical protein